MTVSNIFQQNINLSMLCYDNTDLVFVLITGPIAYKINKKHIVLFKLLCNIHFASICKKKLLIL